MRLQFTLSEAQADAHPDWETSELTVDAEGTVELVYNTLRDSSTSNVVATFDPEQGLWVAEQDGRLYSDVVIAEPTTAERNISELAAIAKRLNIAEDALDEHVHDLVSQDGSATNNQGTGRDWAEIAQLAERGFESISTQVWEPDPEQPGRSRLVRTKTVHEVYRELEACLSEQRDSATWTSWMDGLEEGLSISLAMQNPDTTPWPAAERVVAFSIRGGSEGDYVHVEALTEEGPRPLLLGKTFTGRDSAWRAARRIADLLGL